MYCLPQPILLKKKRGCRINQEDQSELLKKFNVEIAKVAKEKSKFVLEQYSDYIIKISSVAKEDFNEYIVGCYPPIRNFKLSKLEKLNRMVSSFKFDKDNVGFFNHPNLCIKEDLNSDVNTMDVEPVTHKFTLAELDKLLFDGWATGTQIFICINFLLRKPNNKKLFF